MLKYQNLYRKENKRFQKLVKDNITRANLLILTRFDNIVRGWVKRYKELKNLYYMLSREEANYAYKAKIKQQLGITEDVVREDIIRVKTAKQLAEDSTELTRL